MAEGGQPPVVYHFENVETVNVVHDQKITHVKKSPIGTIIISPTPREDAFFVDDEIEQTESDKIHDSKQPQDEELRMNQSDITWLQSGKFGVHIKKPLQTGAKVYQGEQRVTPENSRDVAVKLIEFDSKNRKEVEVLLKLQHPNIVQIIDAGDHRGAVHWIYIVMELCSQNLQNYIDENKLEPRDFKKLFSFSKQLVTGLAYLHQNKIVHRDLKPENVLISMCKEFIKLSDFGLSKEMQKSRSVATVTTIGVGSDGYRPPETYRPTIRITPRLDIFPLGLILHLLFTNGEHPFGSDPYDWSYNIRRNRDLSLSGIPEFEQPHGLKKNQLTDLLSRMLRQAPRDRPTAEEVKNDSFFKDFPQTHGTIIEEQDAAIDISSASASCLPCEKAHRNLNSGEAENLSIVQNRINELENLAQETSKELGEKEETHYTSLPSVNSPTFQPSTDSERLHNIWMKSTNIANDEVSSAIHNVESISIPPTVKNAQHLEVSAAFKLKDSQTKPKKGLSVLERMRFRKAVGAMYKLYHSEESDKFKVLLKIAGYELYLQRGREQDSIRRVQDVISSSKLYSAAGLLELASASHKKEKYVRSLILLHVCHNLHKSQQVSPDDAMKWFERLAYRISVNCKPLIEAGGVSRGIGMKYGLEYMERLLYESTSVKKANPKSRVLTEVYCLVCTTYICSIAGEYQKMIHFGMYGVTLLEKLFGPAASNYRQYGKILNNLGVGYEGCGNNLLAKKYFVSALESYKEVKNISEDKRREFINTTTNCLERIRKKIIKSEEHTLKEKDQRN